MTESIIVALITGGLSLLGVVVTCIATSRKSEEKQEISMAIMRTEMAELTREVREHNNFASRMPVVEIEVKNLKGEVQRLAGYHTKPTN